MFFHFCISLTPLKDSTIAFIVDMRIKTAALPDDTVLQGRPRSIAMSSPIKLSYDDDYDRQEEMEVSRIDPEEKPELAYHIRWQLSRSLTTQHLLTVVSITNTLMNHSVGAHALSSSSGEMLASVCLFVAGSWKWYCKALPSIFERWPLLYKNNNARLSPPE